MIIIFIAIVALALISANNVDQKWEEQHQKDNADYWDV